MKKILIIRLSSIGDIVLTTPVIRCARQQLPGTAIHFAVKKSFLPVIRANPNIDKIHVFDGDLEAFIGELRAEDFDFIIDLHHSLRSGIIRRKLKVRSATFPKLNLRKWLLVRFKINLMPPLHIVDRYFMAARPLGVVNDGMGLDYFIPAGEEFSTERLPEPFRAGFAAFAIGARHATKRLPAHKIISICNILPIPVVLLGGPEDKPVGDAVAEACGQKVLSLCGAVSLNGSASLVKQSRIVFTHDTGLMHIAAAFRKKIVSIWGNTVPALGMYPYLPGEEEKSAIVETEGLKCRPCSKLGYDHCPKKHFRCMEDIDPEEVARRGEMLL